MLGSLVSSLTAFPADLSGVLQSLTGASLSQHARLIRLDGTPSPVVVERFSGVEGIDTLFGFDVEVLTGQTELPEADWFGKELALSVVDANGMPQVRFGVVAGVDPRGGDGGVNRFLIRLVPWADAMTRSLDCWIFQSKTCIEIAEELFKDYPNANWKASVTQPLRRRSICAQYQESDWSFLRRILAEEGLSIVFEHLGGGAANGGSACLLHIVDSAYEYPECPVSPIRFGLVSAALSDDRMTQFSASKQVATRSVALSSWDYDRLHAPAGEAESAHNGGEQPTLQDYDGSGAYAYDDPEHAARLAELRQKAHDAGSVQIYGEGAVRALRVGQRFTLIDHPNLSGKRFTVLAIEHAAANNLSTGIGDLMASTQIERGSYRNQIVCLPDEYDVVPKPQRKPSALAQTAQVVGLESEPLTSDREHRVKIQFAWQRGSKPLNGGLAHATEDDNAPGDEKAISWVRVAEWLAGPNWGSHFTPRVGDEVKVEFVEGDIDRPLVVGSAHNEQEIPPFSAGADSGANHPGTVSGVHSQALDGSGHTRFALDDTPSQLRTQLQSSVLATELNLGYIVGQPAHSAYRGQYRGSGLELRSDGWGVLRAETGLLLSTYARAQGSSTQLDYAEAKQQLEASQALVDQLNQTAATHTAIPLKAADKTPELHRQLAAEAGSVNGQAAQKASGGGRDLSDPVERLESALAVLSTPSSLLATTAGSQLTYAGSDLQLVSQADTHLTAHDTLGVVAGDSVSLFTHHGGLKVIAANEAVSIAAHTETLQLISEQALTITSSSEQIEVLAKDSVTLHGGGAEIELKGGNITFKASGNFTVKAASVGFPGGGSQAAELNKLPDTRLKLFDQAFVLKDEKTGALLANYPYRIKRADGTYESGVTDDHGLTHVISSAEAEAVEIEIERS